MNSASSTERRLITLVGALQFIITLVFSMVLPLAPMFSRELAIPSQNVGIIGGAYIIASAASGFLGTLYLDRFDRRRGMAFAIAGLVVSTAMSGFAPDLFWLVASRILTGLFSGPAYALAIATVIDNVPVERRGRALGAIAGSGSLAMIIGVPLSLEVAHLLGSWRYPFFAVAVSGAALALWGIANLEPQRAHLEGAASRLTVRQRLRDLGGLLTRPACLLAYSLQMAAAVPLVALSTIMAVFLVNNLGLPPSQLPLVYLVGGGANFFLSRIIGRLADRFGAAPISVMTTALVSAGICFGYLGLNPGLPLLVIFPVFFVANSARTILIQTVAMRIPQPHERAGFQAMGQSVQSMAMGLAAIAVTYVVGSTPDGKLVGVTRLASGILLVVWSFPVLLYRLERALATQRAPDGDLPAPAIETI